ncbi:MAG: hypothetical protein GF334_01165 [Candidatus Altiarchaeales archaeon]|nr:hypothetical protein [Candidatus Altiarchaeales archaeon]
MRRIRYALAVLFGLITIVPQVDAQHVAVLSIRPHRKAPYAEVADVTQNEDGGLAFRILVYNPTDTEIVATRLVAESYVREVKGWRRLEWGLYFHKEVRAYSKWHVNYAILQDAGDWAPLGKDDWKVYLSYEEDHYDK